MTRKTHNGTSTRTPVASETSTPWRPWAAGWLGVLGLAVVNGGVHRAYEPALGALPAGQLWPITVAGIVPAPAAARLRRGGGRQAVGRH